MTNKKRIKWIKWIDPLAPENEDDKQSIEINQEEEEERPYKDTYDEIDKKVIEDKDNKPSANIGPVIVSPIGIIPLNEHNIPSKVFNFWMGHSNFILKKRHINIIENTAGVESLDIFTRYRFRVGIGIAFDEHEVMESVENNLCRSKERKENGNNIALKTIKQHLRKNYPFWAIFVLPDGQVDYRTGDTKEIVKEKIEAYPDKASIITSWEKSNGKNS